MNVTVFSGHLGGNLKWSLILGRSGIGKGIIGSDLPSSPSGEASSFADLSKAICFRFIVNREGFLPSNITGVLLKDWGILLKISHSLSFWVTSVYI